MTGTILRNSCPRLSCLLSPVSGYVHAYICVEVSTQFLYNFWEKARTSLAHALIPPFHPAVFSPDLPSFSPSLLLLLSSQTNRQTEPNQSNGSSTFHQSVEDIRQSDRVLTLSSSPRQTTLTFDSGSTRRCRNKQSPLAFFEIHTASGPLGLV